MAEKGLISHLKQPFIDFAVGSFEMRSRAHKKAQYTERPLAPFIDRQKATALTCIIGGGIIGLLAGIGISDILMQNYLIAAETPIFPLVLLPLYPIGAYIGLALSPQTREGRKVRKG